MENREFLLLAQVFDSDKHDIGNFFASIKLDGQRCFWDGGLTTGMPKKDIPWANNNKDSRYKEPPISSGLWSRYGNCIHAPQWFINQLPKGIFCDGELYGGRGTFQDTCSIIKTIEPGSGWNRIKYRIFDLPSANLFFQHGRINNPNFHKEIIEQNCIEFYKSLTDKPIGRVFTFRETVSMMAKLGKGENWSCLNQVPLPSRDEEAKEKLYELLEKEVALGGEGLMVRAPSSMWIPKRSKHLLKVKNFEDGEVVISGFTCGIGKHRGRMGALIVHWIYNEGTEGARPIEFQLSGFSDQEREFDSLFASDYAYNHPGEILLGPHACKMFARGQRIRFRHRGVTNDGVPREARYWR